MLPTVPLKKEKIAHALSFSGELNKEVTLKLLNFFFTLLILYNLKCLPHCN